MAIGAIIAGSLNDKRLGGGPLLVAQSNELSWIDPQSRTSTPLIDDPRGIFGVARSTDGGSVSFWTGTAERPGTTLELVGVDGTGRRILATNVTPEPVGRGSIDVWSADDRYLAAAVTADGRHRILVVDVASGEGRLIGPDDGADNPLWSPDGEWLAFTHEHAGGPNTLAVMRRDGSEVREISTNVDARVAGPDNWSSDGTWIYFDAGQRTIHLATTSIGPTSVSGLAEQLTFQVPAGAPALSPDDSQVAFMLWTPTRGGSNPSVWVMNSDGSEPRQLVPDAVLRGWSPDGHYVLVGNTTQRRSRRTARDHAGWVRAARPSQPRLVPPAMPREPLVGLAPPVTSAIPARGTHMAPTWAPGDRAARYARGRVSRIAPFRRNSVT